MLMRFGVLSEVISAVLRLYQREHRLSIRTLVSYLTQALGPHCTPPDRRASGGTVPWLAGRTWRPVCWLRPWRRRRRRLVMMFCRPFQVRVCVCVSNERGRLTGAGAMDLRLAVVEMMLILVRRFTRECVPCVCVVIRCYVQAAMRTQVKWNIIYTTNDYIRSVAEHICFEFKLAYDWLK